MESQLLVSATRTPSPWNLSHIYPASSPELNLCLCCETDGRLFTPWYHARYTGVSMSYFLKHLFFHSLFKTASVALITPFHHRSHVFVSPLFIHPKVTISGFDLTSYRDCLTKWSSAVETMYSQCRAAGENRCLPVRYEQLVLRAEEEMRKLLHFLDLPWDPSVLHHEELIGKAGGVSLSKWVSEVCEHKEEPIGCCSAVLQGITPECAEVFRYLLQRQIAVAVSFFVCFCGQSSSFRCKYLKARAHATETICLVLPQGLKLGCDFIILHIFSVQQLYKSMSCCLEKKQTTFAQSHAC